MRATDATSLFVEQIFTLKTKAPNRNVVINEIHYNPAENPIREEFIELYNPSNAPVNLSLWRLHDGVDFVFTDGTTIPAGGYLVVASDPATIQSRYGKVALGPWTGSLSNDGERVTLRDPADNVVDEVDYRAGFHGRLPPMARSSMGCSIRHSTMISAVLGRPVESRRSFSRSAESSVRHECRSKHPAGGSFAATPRFHQSHSSRPKSPTRRGSPRSC